MLAGTDSNIFAHIKTPLSLHCYMQLCQQAFTVHEHTFKTKLMSVILN